MKRRGFLGALLAASLAILGISVLPEQCNCAECDPDWPDEFDTEIVQVERESEITVYYTATAPDGKVKNWTETVPITWSQA